MTTYKLAHTLCKAKVRGLCLVLLSLHLSVGDVPGPCRYSVRKDHLDTVRRLTENQLQNGCSIVYKFTERGSLSNTCYVKAALPQILELINTHFRYSRSSDNGRYVEEVKALIHNMYSQNCIPPIDEELEDDPTKFNKVYRESPREALERVKEVFSLYLELMSTSNTPVDWNCDEEYAENELGSSTPLAQTTDPLGHDSGKPYQSGNPEMWHNSNALAFIMAPVCGGLLLIPAFYCLRRQKKLQDLLKRFQTIENQRLNSLSTDVEMQDCETAVQACLSSQYSGELQNQDFHR